MNLNRWLILLFVLIGSYGCIGIEGKQIEDSATNVLTSVEQQLSLLLADAHSKNKNPRTISKEGNIHWATRDSLLRDSDEFDWTLGFFPGSCWYMYEYTDDEKWKNAAEKFQALHEKFKTLTTNHDLGFVFNCSYGNAYRITQQEEYKKVLIEAGDALITRYNQKVGCIKSWDVDSGWQATRGWKFPVIIDNMMNLEMLFELSKLTGDNKYREVAIAHANTTLKNHFRTDNSSYHVIDYDPETGEVRNRNTAQGLANESAWARGQAWGLYGFTVCYRYTKDPKYLEQAKKIADFICSNNKIPKDGIPYWDYDAPNIPNEPRDASAGAVAASALLELNEYTDNAYLSSVDKIIQTLSSPEYSAKPGEIHNFVLKHSVGSIPHDAEIDVPLNYADYYYIEALMRKRRSLRMQ
ncbi:MAG: glycoside hydrolase family 88 protein [Reichenbachiella sp.]|uniref:glycoside hydrolase family 88 protein n=1 Tax=Reichenbachiella sp. TaxID=2184521 RepID=UPI00329694B9